MNEMRSCARGVRRQRGRASCHARVSSGVCRKCLYDRRIRASPSTTTGLCNYCQLHDEMELAVPDGRAGAEMLGSQSSTRSSRRARASSTTASSGSAAAATRRTWCTRWSRWACGRSPCTSTTRGTRRSRPATSTTSRGARCPPPDLRRRQQGVRRHLPGLHAGGCQATSRRRPTSGSWACSIAPPRNTAIKYIIEGHSFRTEGVSPLGWLYMDGQYIQQRPRAVRHGCR